MTALAHSVLAMLFAAVLTLLDLDRTFTPIGPGLHGFRRSKWWWGFVGANAVLAGLFFLALSDMPQARSWNPWLFSAVVGLGYLALVRIKLATISIKGQEVAIGLDALYEAARHVVLQRINQLVKAERLERAHQLIEGRDLRELGTMVRLDINLDALLSPKEKRARLTWLLRVLKDSSFDAEQKKLTLAIYLASGAQI